MASPPFKKLPQRMPLAPLPVPPPRLVVDDIHQATSPVDPERRRRRTQRRESLDSRRSSLPHASPIPQQQQHQNIPQPFSNSLYDNLATYTFGDVRSSPRSTHSHSESPRHHNQDDEWDDLAYDEDDDHDRARNDRAKMRAIDDGSRRPSLPSNLPSPTSRRPSLPIAVPQSPVDSSPYAGFDLSYILAPPLPASFPPRRPSTASALSNSDGNTDTFARHVRKNDSEYERRKGAWSFKRTAGVSSRPGPSGEKGGYQVWGCDCVGRFAISRYKHKDSSHAHGDRPPPNRILFRPLPSSHSSHHLHQLQPVHLVHIHSRTRAFSMYRSPPSKLSPNKTAGGSAFMQVNPSHFILLAPLRVQVQYTETRSTRILKTYDFLGDSPGGSPISKTRESRMPSVPESRERSSSPPLPTPGPAIFVSPPIPIDCDCSSPDFDMNWHVHSERAKSLSPSPPPEPTPIPIQVARVRQSRLGERLKRAFAVAAPPAVEQVHVYPPSHSHSQLSHSHDSHAPHDFSQPYTPPWLTLPLRAEQERNERTMHQLNKSFEDVGLLPVTRQKSRDKDKNAKEAKAKKTRKPKKWGGVFEEVPESAMVMLLPMWGAEDEGENAVGLPPMEERRYILIYYVAFEGTPTEENGGKGKGKRMRMPPPTERESSGQSKEKRPGPQQLSAYRVVAKILSYDDVRMSGLRLPEEGLVLPPALTSPFRRPSSRIFDADSEAAPTIIAVCPGPSPNPSIEFIPEGLEKLGLCQDGTDMSWVDIDGTMSNNNSGERLTLLGRAIVELVWCGCICVMDVEEAL